MKRLRSISIITIMLALLAASACTPSTATPASQSHNPQYYSPIKNANYVSTGATIVVRYGPTLTKQDISKLTFKVTGLKSGLHDGKIILADDSRTVIFAPAVPFAPGEQVNINISGLALNALNTFDPIAYSFSVAANQKPGAVGAASTPPPSTPPASAFPGLLTVPQDIPHFTLTRSYPSTGEGDIFVAPFYWTSSTVGSYLLILNDQGQLVYYQSVADDLSAFDFTVQPNGMLSYFDEKNSTFYIMNSHYQVVNTYQAGDGYTADLHDLQFLPNGDVLLMVYDTETVDMSKVVPSGKSNASVTGLVIQELDPSKNVIFEWRSWDHFAFSDTTSDLTAQAIDLVHGNALALATDGNLLLSSRNQSEITKINLETGDVIWRLGGKANMFKLIGGTPFAFQHDIRQLPNGDITIFDNQGTQQDPVPSQGVEYKLDETNMTATVVWSYTDSPPTFGTFMGNTERLADGNTFMSWGAPFTGNGYSYVTMTEVTAENQPIFTFAFDQPYVSYRAFLLPWQGTPITQPDLAYKVNGNITTLGYSWNGATNVATWEVFGGSSPQSLALIETKPATNFEVQSQVSYLTQGNCYFQVAAMDTTDLELARSKVISTDPVNCPMTP